jgi:putative transposase
LYKWVKKYSQPEAVRCETQRQQAELRELKAELKRATGEREILKKAFIKTHEAQHSVRGMCRMMEVHPSGYYAWRAMPVSTRQRENQRLPGLIKQSCLESGGVYGYRKITHDLRDLGECCGEHRDYRLIRNEGLRSQTGYRHGRGQRYGQPSVAAPNRVQQQFSVTEPNRVWVTDITYLRIHVGWLYQSVVLDLFSRQVIGWSMQPRMESELAINALMMAVWRGQPKQTVIVHSDQGSQFSSHDWQLFLQMHNLPVAGLNGRLRTARSGSGTSSDAPRPNFMADLSNYKPTGPYGYQETIAVGFVIVTQDCEGGMVDIHDQRPVVLVPENAWRWTDAETGVEEAAHIA